MARFYTWNSETGQISGTDDVMEWAPWFEHADRLVALTELPDGSWIRTEFVGLPSRLDDRDRPMIFETSAFDKDGDQVISWLSPTQAEAKKQHADAVEQMKLMSEALGI
jgi:hypothetical protein